MKQREKYGQKEGKTRKNTLAAIGYLMERRGYWELKEGALDSVVRKRALEEAMDLS
jgi:hypothetical protein